MNCNFTKKKKNSYIYKLENLNNIEIYIANLI